MPTSATCMEGDGVLGIEQLVAMLKLSASRTEFDLMMAVEVDGSPVASDLPRKFSDGKPRMEVDGYLWGVAQRSGGGGAGRAPYTLYVLRRSDVATASLMSALIRRSDKVHVILGVYKAGGGSDVEPMLEIDIDKARLVTHCMLTSTGLGGPSEVLGFSGRKFEVRSAPQQSSGIRGGLRTCSFEAIES